MLLASYKRSMYIANTSEKLKIIVISLNIIIGAIIVGFLYFMEGAVEKKSVDDYLGYLHTSKEESVLISDINVVNREGSLISKKYLETEGWIFKEGSDIGIYNCHVALEDSEYGDVYVLPTIFVQRDDVATYFNNLSYANSGFYSKVLTKNINIYDRQLKIVILYENDDCKIYYDTGIWVNNGTI